MKRKMFRPTKHFNAISNSATYFGSHKISSATSMYILFF